MTAIQAVPVTTEFLAFNGGLDTVTPPLAVPPGFAKLAQNFEQDVNGAYTRIRGYERFSGKAKPSDATYAVLTASLSGTPVLYETITGGSSGATGKYLTSATGQIILTATSGTFTAESITGSTSGALGSVTGPAITDGAATSLLQAQYRNAAADYYRSLIAAVTGSGDILGVFLYNDIVYAWRNNVGATAAALYKSSVTGWTAVSLNEEIYFTNANTSVGDGDTLTQGGVTATVARLVLQTGSLASGVNTGKLIISGRAGGNFAGGAATSTGGGTLTLTAVQTAITFLPSGRFETVQYNFTGSTNTKRVYGCDRVNRAWEFDGTTLVPIDTGMTVDVPSHITAHKYQLFLSFYGSVQHSVPGLPYQWSAIVGASEIALGDDVTGFMVQPGGASEAALAIFTRNNIATLYGSGVSNWQLIPTDQEAGAIAYTIQRLGPTLMMDDRGLTSLQATQAYGNFQSATLSKLIHSWLKDKRTLAQASCVARDKNQYRLFFSDNSALYVTMDNGQVVGMMPMLLVDEVTTIWSGEMLDGSEAIFFGSSDGNVYQMEKGTSFDGDAIEAYVYLHFHHSKTPRQRKRYRKASFEVAGEGYAEFNFSYELGYATSLIEQPGTTTVTAALSPSFGTADSGSRSFQWDGAQLLPAEVEMTGTAENVSIHVGSNSDYFEPLKISGAILHYSMRRALR
jgi:hypothetical protein